MDDEWKRCCKKKRIRTIINTLYKKHKKFRKYFKFINNANNYLMIFNIDNTILINNIIIIYV